MQRNVTLQPSPSTPKERLKLAELSETSMLWDEAELVNSDESDVRLGFKTLTQSG